MPFSPCDHHRMSRVDLPRILVIDDALGRRPVSGINPERTGICGQMLLRDVTVDAASASAPRVTAPVAEAVFLRGQKPVAATEGDTVANDMDAVLRAVREGWDPMRAGRVRWSLVLVDLCFYTGPVTPASERLRGESMPEGRPDDDRPTSYFGLQILERLNEAFPGLPVLLFSSMPKDPEVTTRYNARGARGFLAKSGLDLADRLREMLWFHGLFPDSEGEILGTSLALLTALREARVCGRHRRKVLIRGERGTGKELLARFLHRNGINSTAGKLVTVNSSVLTDELFAAELFGVRRGAFTDAREHRRGLVDEAEGGTLFLDEIKDMSPRVQAGVLRLLQEGQVTPVGATEPHAVDVRFLSATEIDIEALAAEGLYRPALLDRLREGGTIVLPPLRSRTDDLPILVEALLRRAEGGIPGAMNRQVTPEAMAVLAEHPWPDNIRGLQACLANAVAAFPSNDQLAIAHLRIPGWGGSRAANGSAAVSGTAPAAVVSRLERFEAVACQLEALAAEFEPGELAFALRQCRRSHARAIALLLRQAASLNQRFGSGGIPAVAVQPTVKLLTGDHGLTTTQAKRLVSKLLSLSPPDIEDLLADPLLSLFAPPT